MCGVNYFVENANRGFDHLSEIVEKLKPKFTEEEYNNLKSLLGCTKVYLKTKYYDNLSSSTSIRFVLCDFKVYRDSHNLSCIA